MKSGNSTQNIKLIIEKLDNLKKKLLTETDLNEIYRYFLDNLGENSQFRALGKVVKHPTLKTFLQNAGKAVTGRGQITNMIILKIASYPFLHGPLFIDGYASNIIYFEDVKAGLLLVVQNGRVHYVRITANTEEEMRDLRQTH